MLNRPVLSDSVTPWTVALQTPPLSKRMLQARILEWVVMPSSRGSSQPRSPTLQEVSLPSEPPVKPKNTGVGSLSLLQGIFLIQESNLSLLHCTQILHQLRYQGFLAPMLIWGQITYQSLISSKVFYFLHMTGILHLLGFCIHNPWPGMSFASMSTARNAHKTQLQSSG